VPWRTASERAIKSDGYERGRKSGPGRRGRRPELICARGAGRKCDSEEKRERPQRKPQQSKSTRTANKKFNITEAQNANSPSYDVPRGERN